MSQKTLRFGSRIDLFPVALALGLLVALGGCQKKAGSGSNNNFPAEVPIGVTGVTINEVAIYQGPKRTLVQNGVSVNSTVPLVAGRDALVRVFYTAVPGAIGRTVTARLIIDNNPPLDLAVTLRATSTEQDYGSTANFVVSGSLIGANSMNFSVGLLEVGPPEYDNPTARYPNAGQQGVIIDGPVNTLRVVVAPFRYDFDGSGRLPDTSSQRLEELRTRLLQLYPVSNVEVTARPAYPWNQEIAPDGSGWQAVGTTLFGFRNQDGESEDVYYYGTFNPGSSLTSWCNFGCLLGVTLLNDDPPDTGSSFLRLALGVGFDEVAADTMAHELGHSHGRNHAPCGQGLDPNSIDGRFPYAGGAIGVWSWDIVGRALIDPSHTDIMGYCENQWISDYTYAALLFRGRNVNLARWYEQSGEGRRYQVISVDASGRADLSGVAARSARPAGQRIAVRVEVDGGETQDVYGHYFRWDHLDGGLLLVPEPTREITRATFVVDERAYVARHPSLR